MSLKGNKIQNQGWLHVVEREEGQNSSLISVSLNGNNVYTQNRIHIGKRDQKIGLYVINRDSEFKYDLCIIKRDQVQSTLAW